VIYRLTFGFGGAGQGWSETHSMQSAITDPRVLLPVLSDLAQKRANFLGAPFAVTHVRLAKFYDETIGSSAKGSVLLKQNYTSQSPNTTGDAEPASVAIIVRGVPDLTNPALADFAGHQNTTWLGGPPDAAISQAGIVNQGAAGLGAALATYWNQMIAANTGWLAQARVDDIKIASSSQNADGTVEILLQRDPVPPAILFRPIIVRVRRVNNGRSPINGPLLGWFNLHNTFQTQDVIGIPTTQVGGMLRTYDQFPTHLPYGGYLVEGFTGEHKRGRPFGTPRGRQTPRARG
jgi:hypothetical protein